MKNILSKKENAKEEFAYFTTGGGEHGLLLPDVAERVVAFVGELPAKQYQILVGSDTRATFRTHIVTAVTLWRMGDGGRYFWTQTPQRTFGVLRERVYAETMRSITLLQELRSALRERLGDDFCDNNVRFVHLDIGRAGKTQELIEAITGMVRGFGFEPVIKPDAFCASSVADRHT
ncbi:MAG: hypothetical protein HYU35_00490 [Parcubacteria group bacterium]|nr:hypothetical protein [Parcubacteria group bacterium]